MPTKKELKQKVKELEAKLGGQEHVPIEPQDIVNWLYNQEFAPHPLKTSTETMRMWLQAMNTRLSTNNLFRRMGRVMELWRQQGIPDQTYTRQQQEEYIAQNGAHLIPVVLTTSWQQYLQTKRTGQEEEEDESMDVEMQSSTELEYSPIVSSDHPPVDPIVADAGFTFTFAYATASNPPLRTARFGFSNVVSMVLPSLDTPTASTSAAAFTLNMPELRPRTTQIDWRLLFRSRTASSYPSTLPVSPSIYESMERSPEPERPAPGPHRYAAGLLPDLFPGCASFLEDTRPPDQQKTQDEYTARQLYEQELVKRLKQGKSPGVSVLPPRLR